MAVARGIRAMPIAHAHQSKSPGVMGVAKEPLPWRSWSPRTTRFPLLKPKWAPKGPSRVSLARSKLMTKKFPGLKDKRGPAQNIRILFKTTIGPLSAGMDAFRFLTLFYFLRLANITLACEGTDSAPSPLEI